MDEDAVDRNFVSDLYNESSENFPSSDEEIEDNIENDIVLNSEEEEQRGDEGLDYDVTMPAQHSYLGNNLHELPGRIVLDDESIVNIPLLSLSGVILVPGQILPLQLEHPTFISIMMNIIDKDRTFGIVAKDRKIGTTVEIRSYHRTESEGEMDSGSLKIKAEGRQRFKLLESWRLDDGFLMGKVKILRDIDFTHPFDKNLDFTSKGNKFNRKVLPLATCWPYFLYKLYDPHFLMSKINEQLHNWANIARPSPNNPDAAVKHQTRQVQENVTTSLHNNDVGFQVQKTVETTIRTDDAMDDISEESDSDDEDFSQTLLSPFKYSFWVAANLPLSDDQRIELLKIPTTIGRLRFEYDLLQKCLYLCCSRCGIKICTREDIFSMSVEGPLQNYVNPAGVVYETLTVYNASNLTFYGQSSTEQSWFPGYSWTMCRCSVCRNSIGWKFMSMKKTRPEYFWGISRASIQPFSAPSI